MSSPTCTQKRSSPWLAPPAAAAEPRDSAGHAVEWYQLVIKTLPRATLDFFEQYVGLRGEEAIKAHIYRVRDKAWKVLPYPCIGLFRFLDFSIHLSPDYPEVVRRVQAGAVFLDLGCCFGQDIRRLAHDAGTSATLIGTDLEAGFLRLGYELFRDAQTLQARFVVGNVFDADFLAAHRASVDIVYLGSFLHLFDEAQQRLIVRQLLRLLRPRAGSLVFGRHLGADQGGPFCMESIGWDLYRHDQQTMAQLFCGVPAEGDEGGDGLRWHVSNSLLRYESANWDDDRRNWQGGQTKQMMFTAVRH